MIILGIDPGLRTTGWGIIETQGNRLIYIADGIVKSDDKASLSERLTQIHKGLLEVIKEYNPEEAAIEETFLNKNPLSTMKLSHARAAGILAASVKGLKVSEYSANKIKKAVVGVGHADKNQISAMLKFLLPKAKPVNSDSADALAVAITHTRYF